MKKNSLQIIAIVASAYLIISYFSVGKISYAKLEKKQPHIILSDTLKKEEVTTKNEEKTDPNNTPDIIYEPTIETINQLYDESSLEQRREVIDWTIARGYIGIDNPEDGELPFIDSDYNRYSLETLIELAKNGDAYANLMIGKILVSTNKNEAAIPYLYEDSINGYTSSMFELGDVYYHKFTQSETFPIDNSYLLESLAWYEAAHLMGDPTFIETDSHINHENEEFRISENDYTEIHTRAKNIYNEIQEKRLDRGMEPFDNSTPELLEKVYSLLRSE